MYEATVTRAFNCRLDGRLYRRRDTYQHGDLNRMVELAEQGLVAFEAPAAPVKTDKVSVPKASAKAKSKTKSSKPKGE